MPTDRRQAGWYAVEDDPAVQRWWNGTQWTTHTRLVGTSTDLTALEGESPHAWSTADDGLVATVDQPTSISSMPLTRYRPAEPEPPDVPPGWYPDPQGFPAMRWWDGWAWTRHTAPSPPPMVAVTPGKSVGVALVLTLFFGPFGMLYSTVTGALVMLVVLFVGGFLVFGLFWFLLWPLAWAGSMVWGALAAARSGPRAVRYWR